MNNKIEVVTRFAPSPTGYLHIGGVRTALYNWIYAKKNNGKFLLRIEDTDQKRSTKEAIDIILEGLDWLGLNFDDSPIFQNKNINRHKEIAKKLLDNGKAYRCWASEEELSLMRENAKKNASQVNYNGLWRNKEPTKVEEGKPYTVRFKSNQKGKTFVNDKVQGTVIFQNINLEDFIILRSDGSPTYMLSAVVDDHDMMVSHIIRGDDHLSNSAKQIQIYEALNWKIPNFSHIPLIHGDDGSKLSNIPSLTGVSTGVGTFIASAGVSTNIDSFAYASLDYKLAEYSLHFMNGSNIQAERIIVMQDNTTAYSNEFAIMSSSDLLISVGATVSGSNVVIQATPETGVSGLTTYRWRREVQE